MRAHAVMIAVGLAFASAAAADPPKAPVHKAEESSQKVETIVPAAAEKPQQQSEEPRTEVADAAKPVRRARVTTCRCGDQNPED